MLFQSGKLDERVRRSIGQGAAIWLGVTQLLLAGVIFYRLYVLGQPDGELRDFQCVLGISLFGFMAIQLFVGGVLPVPTIKGAGIAYCILFLLIAIVSIAVHGWPEPSQWATTWLPGLLGPAIIVGFYWSVAWLGRRKEKSILTD